MVRRQASLTVGLWNSTVAEQAGSTNIKLDVRIELKFYLAITAGSLVDQLMCDDNEVSLVVPRSDGEK